MSRARGLALTVGLVCVGGCGERTSSTGTAASAEPWFREVARESGVDFVHQCGHSGGFYLTEVVAGGVALLDADEDGSLDVYFVQSGSLTGSPAEQPSDRLYRNRGDGTFEDVTERSGIVEHAYGMGAATGDRDNDGHVDLYVTNFGRNRLLDGAGDGTFTDATDAAGVGGSGFGSGAAFLDYDADGDLDLYAAQYMIWSPETERTCYDDLGRRDYCAPARYNSPARDVLYRNDGEGTFTDVSEEAGIAAVSGSGLGVVCGDFSGDGRVDVFVANDGRVNRLWINAGDGRFEEQAMLRGCAMDQDGKAKAGMGVTAADLEGDGDLDLLVCNLGGESDSLYLNQGAFFGDGGGVSGLGRTSRAFTRFGLGWVDFDDDGRLDLYEANGRVARSTDPHDPADPMAEPNLLFRGRSEGGFEEVEPRGGTLPVLVHTSRGAAFGDLDNDGGVDVVVVNRDAAPYVLRNARSPRGHWLLVRVLDEHGRDALGATVTIRIGPRSLRRDVRTAYSYCSASDPRVHFGLGEHDAVDALEVTWIDGTREGIRVPGVDRILEVRRDRSGVASVREPSRRSR